MFVGIISNLKYLSGIVGGIRRSARGERDEIRVLSLSTPLHISECSAKPGKRVGLGIQKKEEKWQ